MDQEPMEVDKDSIITRLESNMDFAEYDVNYFKIELEKTTAFLSNLCEVWNDKLGREIQCTNIKVKDKGFSDKSSKDVVSNEVKEGEILVMIGKARIILGKKGRLQQFRDLIRNCEFGLGEKKTTCSDLQGFWEMINYHVDDIKKGFVNLSKLEENGWKGSCGDSSISIHSKEENDNLKLKNPATALKSKRIVAPKKLFVTNDRKPSSGIREMMAAKRKEMAENKIIPSPVITHSSDSALTSCSIASPKSVKGDERVFDGGFFNISSPSNPRRLKSITPQLSETRNLDTESLSAPSSSASTPVRSTAHLLRRSLLVESASKLKPRENSTKSATSFAILKVNSQIRKSISQIDTPKEPVFKKLRSRTILENSKSSE